MLREVNVSKDIDRINIEMYGNINISHILNILG